MITTLDDTSIIVPNSGYLGASFEPEFSEGQMRLHLNVGVATGSDCDKVQEVLMKVANEHPKVMRSSPAPKVFFENFGDSS